MRQKSAPPETAEQHIKNILRMTRKSYTTEEKIKFVLSGLRGNIRSPSYAGARASPRACTTLVKGIP